MDTISNHAIKTVLLVDDNDIVRTMVSSVLSMDGYNVLVATNGSEALMTLNDYMHGIDLLITDLMMPEMDGKELAAQVSRTHPHVRIIFMSGFSDSELASASTNGDAPLFVKPFSLKILRAKVRELLA